MQWNSTIWNIYHVRAEIWTYHLIVLEPEDKHYVQITVRIYAEVRVSQFLRYLGLQMTQTEHTWATKERDITDTWQLC